LLHKKELYINENQNESSIISQTAMTKLREQLIRIHHRNYRKNMQLVRESLAHNPGIKIYAREYIRYLRDFQEISSKNELIKKVASSDLVFHGDYHTLRQSQRSVLRILREVQAKRDIILCLEMFHAADQKSLNSYMTGVLPESVFFKKINYEKKWPFSWDNWSPLINFCRANYIPILGLNTHQENAEGIQSLRSRDQFAARIIVKTLLQNPGKLVYVVDGDYHVSPNHLPRHVEQLLHLLDFSAKTLIVFQNAENIYWKLCRAGREEADVVKIDENIYCVMNTMPANKIQSYLNWLEYAEEAYYPVHQDWEDETMAGRGLTIPAMVGMIAALLELEFPKQSLDQLMIYYPNNLHFMEHIHDIPGLKGQRRLINEKIKRNEGFLLEYDQAGEEACLIYLAHSNINMAAEEAAHFLNAVLRGRLQKKLDPFDRFYWDAITECLGFFGSKLINEKRKSQTENSIRRFLGGVKQGEKIPADPVLSQVAHLLLRHFYLQRKSAEIGEFRKIFQPVYEGRSSIRHAFSTQLGYILGNNLYYAVKQGKFPLTKIREYFQDPFAEPAKAFYSYLEISSRIR
jgi:uncharacterized iron-regulated protein